MQRLLFTALACLVSVSVFGQTPLLEESFESYDNGAYIGESSSVWTTWSGTTGGDEDGIVTDEQANSGTQSLKIFSNYIGGGPMDGPMDVYLPIGLDQAYEVSFQIYVPSGHGAYINVQEALAVQVGWAFDIVFGSNGQATLSIDQVDNSIAAYSLDAWNLVTLLLDPVNNRAEVYLNSVILNNIPFDGIIGGLSLYSYGGGAPCLYYIDDVVVVETDDVSSSFLENTTTYAVESTAYSPLPFNHGSPVLVGFDDVWSEVIPIPFEFCFFENSYNELVIGANGVVTFDTDFASPPNFDAGSATYCEWEFNQTIPNTNDLPYRNSINGAYHDIDPSISGNIRVDIVGEFPSRIFIINFEDVPHYSCTSITTTQQILLYETTNVIEIYIEDKPTCDSWNDGNAVIGIQDEDGNLGYTPPNRNTGDWTASNEAWRFVPSENESGCTDTLACNFNPNATDDDSCDYESCLGCTTSFACNYDPEATIDDDSCEFICYGCTDVIGCNYDGNANVDDGSCEYVTCSGCTDSSACNYEATSSIDDASCVYPEQYYNCFGSCYLDSDSDGICDELEIQGCTDANSCNYDSGATDDDGTCDYITCSGCIYEFACNYDPEATISDNASCEFGTCQGCTDPQACNYNPTLSEDDGSCEYLDALGICGGDCDYDIDNDGVCDPSCLEDVDNDETITVNDLLLVLSDWGCMENCTADTDGDGIVSVADLLNLLSVFGETCE